MDHIEVPSPELWEERRNWYEEHIFRYEEAGSYIVGDQAGALLFDVQSCFCAGAWVSVIIVAFTVIEAHFRETNPRSKGKKSYELLREKGWEEKLTELRKLRNKLVHATYNNPALTIDEQWDEREALEERAREAVGIMFEVFYSENGT
jgi:hypothetical protein